MDRVATPKSGVHLQRRRSAAATVTATLSQSVVSSITVRSFEGVNTSGTNGSGAIGATASKSATASAPSASVTTTQNYSWVFGVGNDFDNAIPRTPGAGQSLVHQNLTAAGDTYWVQMQNSPTYNAGASVSINDTAPTGDRWNLAVVEVLPTLIWNAQYLRYSHSSCRGSWRLGCAYGNGKRVRYGGCLRQFHFWKLTERLLCGDTEPCRLRVHAEF